MRPHIYHTYRSLRHNRRGKIPCMRGIFSNHFQAWRVLCFCLLVALVFPRAKSQEGGYANSNSVTVGDTIKFYISTSSNHFPLNIFRIGKERKKVLTVGSVTGGIQAT